MANPPAQQAAASSTITRTSKPLKSNRLVNPVALHHALEEIDPTLSLAGNLEPYAARIGALCSPSYHQDARWVRRKKAPETA
jgi:hypothetical protein